MQRCNKFNLRKVLPLLPFLKDKKTSGGISMVYRKPDEHKEPESEDNVALEAAAQDFMKAISNNDHKALALAIKAAFEILSSEEPSEIAEE